jgi:CubicO group peptidase (beta-lactamase class C family)
MTLDTATAARIDAAAREVLAEYRPPGFSVGVVADGALAFAEGYGFADIESARPQAPRLRQRIGSITKTMVGLCAMALVDEGRLSLDDRLADRAPEVVLHGDAVDVTIRHLLTHTGGIGEVAMPADLADTLSTLFSDVEGSGILDMFRAGLTIEAAPGSKWCYANMGYALLGEIIARAESRPIAQVLQDRIFGPLGMADSDLADQPHPDLATGYHRNDSEEIKAARRKRGMPVEDEPTVDGLNVRGPFLYLNGAAAAGAVQSTIPDMARYAIALLNRGGGIVVRRPSTRWSRRSGSPIRAWKAGACRSSASSASAGACSATAAACPAAGTPC